jgi:hypothetical protein
MTSLPPPRSNPVASAVLRLGAAQLILLFGSPDAQREVRGLLDGSLDELHTETARARLDEVAKRLGP